MTKKQELEKRLKEINKLIKSVDVGKGCLAVDQRVKLEIERKKILKELGKIQQGFNWKRTQDD